MRREREQLHQVLDGLGDVIDARLTALQAKMPTDIERFERPSDSLRRRIEALEKRLAR